ncbi:MAG: tail fiber domain-containing protein, partial [Betaproteobacteria bacterium]
AASGGGQLNEATGDRSIVSGGIGNTASGYTSTVAGGSDGTASGSYSFVAGGDQNVASGARSVAMGRRALTQTVFPTNHAGTFVFSDGSSGRFRSSASSTFNVLATGGIQFFTQATNVSGESVQSKGVIIDTQGSINCGGGAALNYGPCLGVESSAGRVIGNQSGTMYFRTNSNFAWFLAGSHSDNSVDPGSGGEVLAVLRNSASSATVTGIFRAQAFTATSDRHAKTDFVPLNAKTILAKVAELPIMAWSFKNESGEGIRHIGPVPQDFRRLFAVGYDDKSIATVDADGVALVAIQGLYQEVQERDARIASQQQRIVALEQRLGEVEVGQLQLQDMAAAMLKLQHEVAGLRQVREVATAPR